MQILKILSNLVLIFNKYILFVTISVLLATSCSIFNLKPAIDYSISYNDLKRIKPLLIISENTLINASEADYALNNFAALLNTLTLDKGLENSEVNILINSPGGNVIMGFNIIKDINLFKKQGKFKIKCYIQEAASMAFTLMVSICDKKIGMQGVYLMQHPVVEALGGLETTFAKQLSLKISKMESSKLNVNEKEWFKLTKLSGDHYFTKEEIKKYKLIDSYEM